MVAKASVYGVAPGCINYTGRQAGELQLGSRTSRLCIASDVALIRVQNTLNYTKSNKYDLHSTMDSTIDSTIDSQYRQESK